MQLQLAPELLLQCSMLKSLAALALAAGAGCTPSSPEARLADLPAPKLIGSSQGVGIDYDTHVDCFQLASQVTGTVDHHPMVANRGGWRSTAEHDVCDGVSFSFPTPLDANTVTSIELADGESTWHVEVQGLAPRSWTVATPATVTEGSDVTVHVAPAVPNVAINFVYLEPNAVGIVPFAAAPTGDTVHIDAGYWSSYDEAASGSTMKATIAVELGPLPSLRCEGPERCDFVTNTPDPGHPVTIVIP